MSDAIGLVPALLALPACASAWLFLTTWKDRYLWFTGVSVAALLPAMLATFYLRGVL